VLPGARAAFRRSRRAASSYTGLRDRLSGARPSFLGSQSATAPCAGSPDQLFSAHPSSPGSRSAAAPATALLLGACTALLLGGCAAMLPGGAGGPSPYEGDRIEAATDDMDRESLVVAIERSLDSLRRDSARQGEGRRIGRRRVSNDDVVEGLERALRILGSSREDGAESFAQTLAAKCRSYRARDAAKVTAYYEPLLAARLQRDGRFRFPLYAFSAEAMEAARARLGRVPTREDIDGADALDGAGLEIAWLDDAVERFFLHVQGSGRLDLGDGTTMRVGFAATNGLDYRSVGARMLSEGLLEPGQATAPAMKAWLAARPERRDALLFHNPRYVFFRGIAEGGDHAGFDGPVGALGVPLVAGRSVAADLGLVPRGALGFLRTTQPVVDDAGRVTGRRALTRFVVVQDTGAAIRGPARLDLFAGSGERAGLEAGAMNEEGEFHLLLCDR
jgi:membrane-bound lytic murein transglycosylase A